MRRTLALLLSILAAAGACERRRAPDPRPMLRQVLRGMLIYPRSTTVSMTAGEDAAQVTLSTTDSVERVAGWFREVLRLNGWALQSDVTNRDGSIAIAATKGARPLWITLQPNVGAAGTTYSIIGAVVSGDSVVAADSASPNPSPATPK